MARISNAARSSSRCNHGTFGALTPTSCFAGATKTDGLPGIFAFGSAILTLLTFTSDGLLFRLERLGILLRSEDNAVEHALKQERFFWPHFPASKLDRVRLIAERRGVPSVLALHEAHRSTSLRSAGFGSDITQKGVKPRRGERMDLGDGRLTVCGFAWNLLYPHYLIAIPSC